MVEARRSVCALRPQEHVEDVGAALTRMVELARRGTDVPIELTVADLPAFTGGADRDILGIAQEALTNAVRHARARRISIRAEGVRAIGFRLSVADDGRGIAKERRETGFGMTSMQERADRIGASLTVVTAARSGTEVVLAWEPPSFVIPELLPEGIVAGNAVVTTAEAQIGGDRAGARPRCRRPRSCAHWRREHHQPRGRSRSSWRKLRTVSRRSPPSSAIART